MQILLFLAWLKTFKDFPVWNSNTFIPLSLFLKENKQEKIIMAHKENTKILNILKHLLEKVTFCITPKGQRLVLIEINITAVIPEINYMALVQN